MRVSAEASGRFLRGLCRASVRLLRFSKGNYLGGLLCGFCRLLCELLDFNGLLSGLLSGLLLGLRGGLLLGLLLSFYAASLVWGHQVFFKILKTYNREQAHSHKSSKQQRKTHTQSQTGSWASGWSSVRASAWSSVRASVGVCVVFLIWRSGTYQVPICGRVLE